MRPAREKECFGRTKRPAGNGAPENVELCAERQDTILDSAAQMLQNGGRLVYSTCTFAPQENEGTISRFLKRYPAFSIVKLGKPECFSPGRPDWIPEPAPGIEATMRLWPHKLKGEGHFLAVLRKEGTLSDISSLPLRKDGNRRASEKECGGIPHVCITIPERLAGEAIIFSSVNSFICSLRGMPSLKGAEGAAARTASGGR